MAVPLAMVGVPMFTAVSAAISADPLANLLAAALLLVLLRVAAAAPSGTARWAVGAGVLIGAGPADQARAGDLRARWRWSSCSCGRRDRARRARSCWAPPALVVLPWLVHQVTTYGWADPLATQRHAAVVLDQPRFPGLSLDYLGDFLTISFHSFWAQFGWMAIVAPTALYWVWGVRRRWRRWSAWSSSAVDCADPRWRLVLATLGAPCSAYVGYNLAFEQFQGRYLFTALVPDRAAAGARLGGLAAASRCSGRRVRSVGRGAWSG